MAAVVDQPSGEQKMIRNGDRAPDFELPNDSGGHFRLSQHVGERLLLVFYPGDNTPVCTAQLCDYRDGIEEFTGLGVKIVGISADGADSHRAFRQKHALPFELLSDTDYAVARRYGCKGALGMKRAVFLLDEEGTVRHAHVETLALFRRKAEELLDVIAALDGEDSA
jgi:peroxiredoxin